MEMRQSFEMATGIKSDHNTSDRQRKAMHLMNFKPRSWIHPLSVVITLLTAVACATAQEAAAPANGDPQAGSAPASVAALRPEVHEIPMPGAGRFGGDLKMVTHVFRPPGAGPFPVVLFSHGRPSSDVERGKLSMPAPPVQVRYWLAKGFVIVAPIRVGYGATGGPDAEANGGRFDSEGRCLSRPAFRSQAEAARNALATALTWVRMQTWADSGRIILEGESVGGFATVAAAAQPQAGVLGYVNFAGGAGGNPDRAPGHSCDPEQITALYTEFGASTKVPSLWIYAENDQFWGPDVPKAWHAGFAKGGSRTTFVQTPPVQDGNGHSLVRRAQRLWAPHVDRFLESIASDKGNRS